jgi:hypothetical protein
MKNKTAILIAKMRITTYHEPNSTVISFTPYIYPLFCPLIGGFNINYLPLACLFLTTRLEADAISFALSFVPT